MGRSVLARILLKLTGAHYLPGGFMNKPTYFSSMPFALALLFGLVLSGSQLSGQQSDRQNPAQPTSPGAQQPGQMPNQPGQGDPDPQGQSNQAQSKQTGSQIFTGTIAKSGSLYVLQDANGTSYAIDHQELAQKYEGKQVRIKGTLDPDGKTIHVQ
jgi:hypothetical protein